MKKKTLLIIPLIILIIGLFVVFMIFLTRPEKYVFKPEIKDENNKIVAFINKETKCKDIYICGTNTYEEKDPETGKNMTESLVVKNETSLRYKFNKNNKDFGMYIIGGFSENDTPVKFEESRVVFLSFIENFNYKVFGLTKKMTEKELIKIYGEPKVKSTCEGITYYEYYIDYDNCQYSIIVSFLDNKKTINRIDINVDNHVIYNHNNQSDK